MNFERSADHRQDYWWIFTSASDGIPIAIIKSGISIESEGQKVVSESEEDYMKILLATDGSKCSVATVNEVAERPWPAGTVIKVLSVIELPFIPTTETWALPESYYAELEKSESVKAQGAVDQAVGRLRSAQGAAIEIISQILEGQAEDVILGEAEKWGANLIIIGSHGYRGFKRFLLGSVSQAVASHARCSVEIVRKVHPD
jgi:nucleotide-binding universal stress UspA family protein